MTKILTLFFCMTLALSQQDQNNIDVETYLANQQLSSQDVDALLNEQQNAMVQKFGLSGQYANGNFDLSTALNQAASFNTVSQSSQMAQASQAHGPVLTGYLPGSLETSSSQILYSKPEITQSQEIISTPQVERKLINQPIITKRTVSQPIIKQQIVQTPIIRKTEVTRPVYTENEVRDAIVDSQNQLRVVPINVPGRQIIKDTFIKPIFNRQDEIINVEHENPQKVVHDDIVRPTQYSESVFTKNVQLPGKEIYYQPIYQKKVVTNQEKLNFIQDTDEVQNLRPQFNAPIVKENTRVETVQRPGKEIVREQYVQPIVTKENVNLEIIRGPQQEIQLHDLQNAPEISNVVRQQTVKIPGQEIITQPIVQEYYQRNDIHHVQNPVFEKVPFTRVTPQPVPLAQKIPVIRRVPIPVPPSESEEGNTKFYKYNEYEEDCKNNKNCFGPRHHFDRDHYEKYYGEEAPWIHADLTHEKKVYLPDLLPLNQTSFYHGWGNQLGDSSNLGLNSYGHYAYNTNFGDARKDFNDKVQFMLENNDKFDGRYNLRNRWGNYRKFGDYIPMENWHGVNNMNAINGLYDYQNSFNYGFSN